jgi:bacteriocin-like protein
MIQLNNEELKNISGGFSLTGAMLNSFIRGINIVLTLGRSLGTAVRRLQEGNICNI